MWIQCGLTGVVGAVELWELSEDESLLEKRFAKLEHDHIVTSVSPAGSSHAISGSMDNRSVGGSLNLCVSFRVCVRGAECDQFD